LLCVITLKTNPKCPSCNFTVPFPLVTKKPGLTSMLHFDFVVMFQDS
jgi:hypothetical protein